ncbi:MAG: PHP domain-containing protein [Cyclonatronaceae bacterium]
MPQKADLHLHTTASDGRFPPEKVVEKCAAAGLSAIAITDHDTVAGYEQGLEAARNAGVSLLPGIEITCDMDGRERHLLAYLFDPRHPRLTSFVQAQRLRRYRRASEMVGNLNRLGFDMSLDEVKAEAGTLNISRNHIAGVMLRKGYVAHKQLVFDKYIGDAAPAYHKTEYDDIAAVIKLVHECGGVAILAHPGRHYTQKQLSFLIEAGIDGFECIHPSHNFGLQKKYRTLCEQHALLKTGGSDFHGHRLHESSNLGIVAVDIGWVKELGEKAVAPASAG